MTINILDYSTLNTPLEALASSLSEEPQTFAMPRGCAEALTGGHLGAVESLVLRQARRRKDNKADLQVNTHCALIPPASLGQRLTGFVGSLAPTLFVATSDVLAGHIAQMLETEPTGRVVYDPLLGSEYCLGWSVPVEGLPREPELSALSEHELSFLQRLELMVPEEPLGQYLQGKRGGLRPFMAVAISTPSTFALGGFRGGQELLEHVHCAQSLYEDYSQVLLPDELADEFRYWQPAAPCAYAEPEVSRRPERPSPLNRLLETPTIRLIDPPRRRFAGFSLEHNGSEQDSGFKLVSTGVFV